MLEIFLIFILSLIDRNNSVFVTVGDYPEHRVSDVNLPECGLSRVPKIMTIVFNRKCFLKEFFNRTLLSFVDKKKFRERPSSRVARGSDTELGEAPWTVYLNFRQIGINRYGCTGVLVTFEWVLTAAHCYDDSTQMEVHAGSNKHEGREVRQANLVKWFRYPYYLNPETVRHKIKANFTDKVKDSIIKDMHDLALVKVDSKFSRHLSKSGRYLINPICLPGVDQHNTKPEKATFYGFGLVDDSLATGLLAPYLQKAQILLQPMLKCKIYLTFCNEYATNDSRTCKGDSGGPLVQFVNNNRGVLVGTLSVRVPKSDETCSTKLGSSHWTLVPFFVPWILETIRDN